MAPGSFDPASTQGIDPGQTEQNGLATEATRLLPSTDEERADGPLKLPDKTSDVSAKPTHYKNIDGHHFWWLFGGIIFGNTIAFFDSTLMASSHPVITSYFHASNSASWLSTVFFLTSTVFQPISGRISDTVGRRPVYLFAICIFLVTTAWCMLAQDIGSFIVARAFAGLGAGGVVSVGFIMLSDVVKIEYRGLYQSYINIAYGLGNSLGAALGGFLVDALGWRAAFGVQLPWILAYLLLAIFTTPNDLGPNLAKSEGKTLIEAFRSFDVAGSLCLTVAVSCLILGINLGGNVLRWSHPLVIAALLIFCIAGALLVFVERKAIRPILPLKLLSTIPISNLMISNFLSSIVTQTILFNAPLFFQAVKQTSPTTSGLYLVSPLVGVTVSSIFTGLFITWTRNMSITTVIGVILLLAGAISTSCLTKDMPAWVNVALLPWASTGQGFFFPTTTVAVLALSARDDQAVVSTTLSLMRNSGAVLGVAISSLVLQNSLVTFLEQRVTGDGELKAQIIANVRKSIKAIAELDPRHKAEVTDAYAEALRLTFMSAIAFTVIVVILILPISLPRLQRSG